MAISFLLVLFWSEQIDFVLPLDQRLHKENWCVVAHETFKNHDKSIMKAADVTKHVKELVYFATDLDLFA